jgi:hypothetical protein
MRRRERAQTTTTTTTTTTKTKPSPSEKTKPNTGRQTDRQRTGQRTGRARGGVGHTPPPFTTHQNQPTNQPTNQPLPLEKKTQKKHKTRTQWSNHEPSTNRRGSLQTHLFKKTRNASLLKTRAREVFSISIADRPTAGFSI